MRVVDVLDAEHIVLNGGTNLGIKGGDSVVIYANDREIRDISGQSLGMLEIVKGYGSVTHVQESMCIVKSDFGNGFKASTYVQIEGLAGALLSSQKPSFLTVIRGDFAKPV